MIIELKDMPNQTIKSINVNLEFGEPLSGSGDQPVTPTVKVTTKPSPKGNSPQIPAEMQNFEI